MPNETNVKKVLHFIPGYSYGGIEERFKDWLMELDKSKVSFDLITYIDPSDKRFDEIKKLGCNVYYIPSIKKVGLLKHLQTAKEFFKVNKEYSALHCHSIDNCYFLMKYAKKNNIKKRILHARTSSYGNSSYKIIRNLMKSKCIKLATDFFGCSDEALSWLKNGKMDDNCVVINNGINTKKFVYSDENRKKFREELGIEHTLVIGHVGRFSYAKNHDFLLQIFWEVTQRKPDSRLLLLGDGELKNEIIQSINDLGLEDKVVIVGFKENVIDYLNSMDLFVFPSHYEGFGTVLIEAQTSGLHCFVADGVPKSTNVTGNVTYLSLDKSAATWAEQIIEKYNMINTEKSRAEYAKSIINTDFDLRKVVDKLEGIYTNI